MSAVHNYAQHARNTGTEAWMVVCQMSAVPKGKYWNVSTPWQSKENCQTESILDIKKLSLLSRTPRPAYIFLASDTPKNGPTTSPLHNLLIALALYPNMTARFHAWIPIRYSCTFCYLSLTVCRQTDRVEQPWQDPVYMEAHGERHYCLPQIFLLCWPAHVVLTLSCSLLHTDWVQDAFLSLYSVCNSMLVHTIKQKWYIQDTRIC